MDDVRNECKPDLNGSQSLPGTVPARNDFIAAIFVPAKREKKYTHRPINKLY